MSKVTQKVMARLDLSIAFYQVRIHKLLPERDVGEAETAVD